MVQTPGQVQEPQSPRAPEPPSQHSLTAILAWKSAVGTMGMGPPCFPNFLSKLSCTDTGGEKPSRTKSSGDRGTQQEAQRTQDSLSRW